VMSATRRELYYVTTVTLVALVLHALIPLFALMLTLPAILVYTVAAPLVYLVMLTVVAELLATQPFGIMTAVVMLPFISSRLFKKVTADISIPYFMLVMATLLLQFIILFVPDIWLSWQAHSWSPLALGVSFAVVPWRVAPWLLVPGLVLYGSSILIYFNRRW